MRIFIKINTNNKPIPFNYQQILTGTIHKWLGINDLHNNISLYSFSSLIGGEKKGDNLIFPNETGFFFSAHDKAIITRLIQGIQIKPYIDNDIQIVEIQLCKTPKFSNKELFYVQSPILVKRKIDGREIHFTFNDQISDEYLTETLRKKLIQAGITEKGITVKFDRSYKQAKTKVIYYKNIGNKANVCPVIVEGNPEQIEFAWKVGLGNSTGIGFGSLK